ncbi:DUF5683 domain-containing protein [Balneolales bacterium ANBcel1]|nr:DUF5683 domain-containing protein [Balneolales bacterium ANBcel1]
MPVFLVLGLAVFLTVLPVLSCAEPPIAFEMRNVGSSERILLTAEFSDEVTFQRRIGYQAAGSIKLTASLREEPIDTVPNPSSVLRKSMILPGWGQITNDQTWKVPVIYGLFAGLTYYSISMNQNYRDYRAAYYNSQYPDGDQRFGPTPASIDPNTNPQSLRFSRNAYRNRRDLTLIGIALAYGLNLVDAYVFAHMRDFDVSDDLSANIYIVPPSMDRSSQNAKAFQSAFKEPSGFQVTLRLSLP